MTKPNIEEVFLIISNYQEVVRKAAFTGSIARLGKVIAEEQMKVKEEFDRIGLAEHIDWAEPRFASSIRAVSL